MVRSQPLIPLRIKSQPLISLYTSLISDIWGIFIIFSPLLLLPNVALSLSPHFYPNQALSLSSLSPSSLTPILYKFSMLLPQLQGSWKYKQSEDWSQSIGDQKLGQGFLFFFLILFTTSSKTLRQGFFLWVLIHSWSP